jgi:hypothetical protein
MKLLAKFNLIFVLVFGAGLGLAIFLAYGFLRQDAKNRVIDQAKLMMETTFATRNYTTDQIKPVLGKDERQAPIFLPQIVPAFAATHVFKYLHDRNPDYSYREATLNPTNLENRATDWEVDIINTFRNDPKRQDVFGERETPTGPSLFYARPIVAVASCLECHSTPDQAPQAMIRQYGQNNGFGWKLGETIGAQIVSVPSLYPSKLLIRH